jgi:Spy/CpxP family protein refolding chaperone
VDAIRDRVVQHFKSKKDERHALIDEARAIWLEDTIDEAKVEGLRGKLRQLHAAREQIISQSLRELHGILTKEQRAKLVKVIDQYRQRWMKKHRGKGIQG